MSQINADLTVDATVETATLPWDPSPAAGVWRRRIERDGDEVARLTSVVRYGPDSHFPPHTHGGGEEYLVLRGTFSDENGDHGPGTYVRNGVGTSHSPFTTGGCEILVRLWWMFPDQVQSEVIDTTASTAWRSRPWGRELLLHQSEHECVRIIEVETSQRADIDADGGLEIFIVDGALQGLPEGSWIRRVGLTTLSIQGDSAARLLVRTGHLRRPPPLPSE